MSKSRGVHVSFMAALVALVALFAAPGASAQLTVGQTAPPGDLTPPCTFSNPYDEVQTGVAAGNSYTVPAAGLLTSWSTNPGSTVEQALGFKVFRPVAGAYLVVAQDQMRPLLSGVLNTFPIAIPVLAGDLIGVYQPGNTTANCSFQTGLAADTIVYQKGNVAPGATLVPTEENNLESERRLNVSATLLPPPTVSALSPAKGSVVGGGKVVITGANFASVSAVSFGATPAKSFTVDSETQITAIAPKNSKLVKVAVSVTTAAGLAGAPTTFAYEGCRVPKLKDKKLKAVKKQAKKADCKIGKVKKQGDATAKTGEVVKQNPKPGKILAPGTKIKVTLDA